MATTESLDYCIYYWTKMMQIPFVIISDFDASREASRDKFLKSWEKIGKKYTDQGWFLRVMKNYGSCPDPYDPYDTYGLFKTEEDYANWPTILLRHQISKIKYTRTSYIGTEMSMYYRFKEEQKREQEQEKEREQAQEKEREQAQAQAQEHERKRQKTSVSEVD